MISLQDNEELLNKVAFALHYNGWYKDTIEGKYGLNTDGADHGRFRPSKNAELDAEFFASLNFNEEGYSLVTDKHGNPLYKREIAEDGSVKYFVDSAIKGWTFLPPSWQEENLQAAQTVLSIISSRAKGYDTSFVIFDNLKSMGGGIHTEWVKRQLESIFGLSDSYWETLNNADLQYIKGEISQLDGKTQQHSHLFNKFQFFVELYYEIAHLSPEERTHYTAKNTFFPGTQIPFVFDEKFFKTYGKFFDSVSKQLDAQPEPRNMEAVTKELFKNVWGIENFVSYNELPFEEQLKDIRQVSYALKVICANPELVKSCDEKYIACATVPLTKDELNKLGIIKHGEKIENYFLDQEMLVSDKINQMILENSQNKNKQQDN